MGNNDGRSWGYFSETNFIDNLGNWNEKNIIQDRPYQEWLVLYVVAHQESRHKHHRQGVVYAQEKLAKIKAKND